MRRVAIAGTGGTDFTRSRPAVKDVMLDSIRPLLLEGGIDRGEIDAVLVSTNDDAKYLGAIVSETAGISPKISHSIENMCSSGANAIVSAYSYIASGLAETALVVGADRFDGPGQVLEWDESRGEFGHPVFWASVFAGAYKRHFGASDEDMACVAAKNHRNAVDNPHAVSRGAHGIKDVLSSRRLTEDLRLLECSSPSTGGAAVLLASEEKARKITDAPVWITGIGHRTTAAGFTRTADYTRMESAADAARQALGMAGAGPGEIDVAEVHDAFAVCEALAVEGIGIAKRGSGAKLARQLYETQDRMINPRGGLIGSGHPPGATGIAQAAEIAQQLQGRAGRRQVDAARTGLVHNMSAAATSSTVLVMTC